ncbi:MAG: hypothetical protein RL748_793 [Pseudomonadota bacterium]|jgi:tRNA(fMet)-specific endonuclease VapC
MTVFLLDTNAWIGILKNQPGLVRGVQNAGVESLRLCAPVWSELWFGACKSTRIAENQMRIKELAQFIPSLPFDDRAAEHCGEIRALLAREGRPIGPYDLQIAAIARATGCCLVTRNLSEFSRVPGLSFENWQDTNI